MLATYVKTTGDLMSIALQAEREAIRRYSQLAANMREGNNESAAALFERMVIEEQEHERLLLKWIEQEGLVENHEIGHISWRDPQVSTTYDDEARDPYYSTPYKALAFAVHNEEIAFSFYTHVAANSKNKAVQEYAEILAREELGHAALLRAERRRAYHVEHDSKLAEPRLDPRAVHNEADLFAAAIRIDHNLVEGMNIIATSYPEIEALAKETRDEINSSEKNLNDEVLKNKTTPSEDILRNLEELDIYNEQMAKISNSIDSKLHRLHACCDRSFVFYDAIVETASDEALMLSAQKLASSALDRIGVLKQIFGDISLSEYEENRLYL